MMICNSSTIVNFLKHLVQVSILFLSLPLWAYANLPTSSNVPGGVAIVPLGRVADISSPPKAWLGEQSILVAQDSNQWVAVVGLSLDILPGPQVLRVSIGDEMKTQNFMVKNKDYPQQNIVLKDNSKVQLSDVDMSRVEKEIAVIQNLKLHWRNTEDIDLAFIIPAKGRLAGRFGLRRFFNGEARSPHSGLDVAVASGTPILASSSGNVLATDDYFFNGRTVFMDHGNGLITMYCHLDRIDVKPGEVVKKGQKLGLSGKTGRATGPHLHWSIVLNGAMVDPELFINVQHKH